MMTTPTMTEATASASVTAETNGTTAQETAKEDAQVVSEKMQQSINNLHAFSLDLQRLRTQMQARQAVARR
ncbi:hypothetical protein Poli38472_006051 [Pythium oligandrum]|uniref:Uncharacterized protein n=1 Tax=Pythium oligandrum TaxID=41045 RepID=A0A8K1CTD8_PYTOL|nr:hypothetical protein Poli38472_006051 [Pythium oligandrum]|eukprot:TMW68583.1 hypothetical protein Poli38472_006051 [Pythium oligandrum]